MKPVGLATPAQPGQTVLLTGSGLGNSTPFQVSVGGAAATVVHPLTQRADRGYDRIFVQIPASAPDGCYVPLRLTYNPIYNQVPVTTSISKTSNGGPCVHPLRLSTPDLQTLDSGGSLAIAQISMNTDLQVETSTAASRGESANISVSQWNAAGVAAYFAPAPNSSCSVAQPALAYASYLAGDFGIPPIPDLGVSMTLQSGSTNLSLTGDGYYYAPTNFPNATEGPLNNLPAPVIAAGKWTWTSSGGADLPASSFGFNLPAPFQLNSGAPVSLNHDQDQTLTWNGANFPAGSVFAASLSGTVYVSCSAPASAGALTIPAALLAQFAPSSLGTLSINVSQMGSSIPHTLFKLKNGNTLLVFVSYSTGDTRAVDFQ
jgi:hypothetical protein